MKNKLIDLNDHLFAQMERLGEEDITQEQMQIEIDRTKNMSIIAKKILENASLALDAQKALGEQIIKKTPAMIGLENK